ncbi:septal ring lytic transglycosylase RlpA family protein [Rhizobium sp. SL86]|uniref:septal ring lytic transglycosylase RlpA family protein n=1 Tax=Rhizobium sp. SL86 TaxID=2995148 RepID=UPI0022732B6E|nr:septal ring lytic transglycosylase RlpA family protein [Rhizobium sp. SL86]MCY1668753.1 septal ring lytic transglycosylase RlpA family protein [Rhizobium sp. SL86]
MKWLGVACVCLAVTSCASTQTATTQKPKPKSKEYFAESEYGVKASPRVVADGQPVPKGGGRFMVGDPYQVKGKTYVPKEDPRYNKSGLASWYGSAFHGRVTANGEVYDSDHISAAHPTFPLPSYARVTNMDTGSSVIVRVNDRGPFHEGRIIDVSSKAAELLDFKRTGTARVNVQYVGRARMDGRDMPFLMASYVRKGERLPGIHPDGQIATGVMVASNQSLGDQLQSFGNGLPEPARAGAANRVPTKAPTTTARPANPTIAAPMPVERPTTVVAAAPKNTGYQVASLPAARPVAVAPKNVAPLQKPVVATPLPAVAPVQKPAVAARQPAPAAVQVVRPAPAPAPVATAYAAQPSSRNEPRVIFGNVVLRGDGVIEKTDQAPTGKAPTR